MKKSILLTLFATLAIILNAQQLHTQQAPRAMAPQAVAEETPSMEYGYCGTLERQIGWGEAGTIRAVIEIPQEVSAKYQGAQITQVLAGIGNDAGADAKVIIMRTLDDSELLYSQNTKFTKNDWNTVEMETPFTLDGNGFYIGYELTVSSKDTYPVGVDAEEPSPMGDLCAMYNTQLNEWIWEHLADYNFGNNCIKIVLTGDNLPKYNLALQNITIKEYVRTGAPFAISGTVKNIAALTAETFEVSYKIGDMPAVANIINTPVASGATANFTIEDIVIEQDGVFDITVEITSVGGNADEDNSDNSFTKKVNCMSNLVPRKILIEEFSTTQCGNCPRMHTVLKDIREGREDIALVVHHAGYGQDNYTIAASRSYLDFYESNTYAPALMIDRCNLADQGAEGYSPAGGSMPSPGPVFAPSSQQQVEKLINYSLDQPAFVTVNIEDTYNAETRELTVRVYGESVIDLPQTPYINIFVTESGMINYQSGGGNDYEHNHAIRDNLTNTWGDVLEITNSKYDVTYTTTLNTKWMPENMEVIAFISHYDGTNVNNCQVYNTEYKDLNYDASVNKMEQERVDVWTANGKIYIAGAYEQAEVFAIDGRLVTKVNNTTSIEVENGGIYVVRVDGQSFKVIL